MILNDSANDKKIALKGVTTRDLEKEEFLSALYTGRSKEVKESRFQISRTAKRIELVENQKQTLNWLYVKLRVDEDLCTVSPLTKNNELI